MTDFTCPDCGLQWRTRRELASHRWRCRTSHHTRTTHFPQVLASSDSDSGSDSVEQTHVVFSDNDPMEDIQSHGGEDSSEQTEDEDVEMEYEPREGEDETTSSGSTSSSSSIDESSSDHPASPEAPQKQFRRFTQEFASNDLQNLPQPVELVPEDGFTVRSIPFQTKPDHFGVYRVYPHGLPSYTPDHLYGVLNAVDSPALESFQPASHEKIRYPTEIFGNESLDRFMGWFQASRSVLLSKAQADSLIKDVIQAPCFDKDHFTGVTMDKLFKKLDDLVVNPLSYFPVQDKWVLSDVSLRVPVPGAGSDSIEDAPSFTLKNVCHRRLIDVITSALDEPASEYFHISPFTEYWKPSPDGEPVRLEKLHREGGAFTVKLGHLMFI
ncbi:hypothetical protein CC2G_012329 [Coprinopsis cinerea AmutBmut pab1-1]|nr:hypothetical protein CC2G_012329 [Coprinopsis cinerea AmutBmut pab1-1]